ncbi:MAG: hypothetical protein ACI9WU_000875 [Myxococcota bacterium]
MNKGTIVAVIAAIGALAYMSTRSSGDDEVAGPQTISGYLDANQQSEWRTCKENPLLCINQKAKDRETKYGRPPYDGITITRNGTKISFGRVASHAGTEGKEDEWTMTAPVESEVENYRIKAILEAFATDTALTPARSITNPEHLADFGLAEGRRISFELQVGGVSKVAMIVGNKEKTRSSEQGGQDVYDTFVLLPGSSTQVYRAKQKDLRDLFDHDVAALRSKKVFGFDKSDITRVTINNPANQIAPKIVVAATWEKAADPAADAKPDPKKPKPQAKGTYTIVAPILADYRVGKLDTFFGQISGLRASEYLMGEKPPADSGLAGDDVPSITVEREGVEPITIFMGGVKEKDKTYYARVQGRDEYMLVSKYAKDNLIKTLGSLRDKSILGEVEETDVTRIEIKNEATGDGSMIFERGPDGWKMTAPTLQIPWEREMKSLVSGVKTLRAADFLDGPPEDGGGLDKPSQVIKATIAGKDIEIRLGTERDSHVIAHLVGTTVYFRVSTWTRDKYKKAPRDFRDKALMAIADASAVVGLELIHTSETVKLLRVPGQAGQWQMTEPAALTGASGLANKKVEALASSLKSLSIKDFTDKTADAVGLAPPAFTLVAKMADGSERRVLASNTQEGNDNYVSLVSPLSQVGSVYTLTKYKLDNLRKKAADLKE